MYEPLNPKPTLWKTPTVVLLNCQTYAEAMAVFRKVPVVITQPLWRRSGAWIVKEGRQLRAWTPKAYGLEEITLAPSVTIQIHRYLTQFLPLLAKTLKLS